jgi:hypothetical protein
LISTGCHPSIEFCRIAKGGAASRDDSGELLQLVIGPWSIAHESFPAHRLSQFEQWHGWQESIYQESIYSVCPRGNLQQSSQAMADEYPIRPVFVRFEVVRRDVVRVADNANLNRIYEHGQNLRGQ